MDRLPALLVRGRELLGGPAEEAGERGRVRPLGEVGRSIASSRRSHSRAGGVPKTLPAPLMTAGMSDVVESLADQRGVAIRANEHCDMAGTHALAVEGDAILGACSISAADESISTRSAARSLAMCSRALPLLANPAA